MKHLLLYLFFLVTCFSIFSCKRNDSSVLIRDSVIQNIALSDTSDAVVITIKSAEPLKSIVSIDYIDDYLFMLSSDKKTLYCVQNDTVISKLEKVGRGPGEYKAIELFSYSEIDSMLYIYTSDVRILKFKGPDFSFVDGFSKIPTIQSIRVVDKSNLFVSYSTLDCDDAGLALMSSETGKINKKLNSFDEYVNMYFSNQKNFCKCEGKIIFPIVGYNSFSINRFENGSVDNIKVFRYDKKWKTPKKIRVEDYSDINQFLIYNDYILKENRCMGGYYPLIYGDKICFWSYYINKGVVYDYILNEYDGQEVRRYRINIPGLLNSLRPSCVLKGRYARLFQTTKEDLIDNNVQLSPLGQKIIDITEKQNGNPIIILFF